MEILQTIWNALTTENELIIKLQGIPLTFIEAYVTMLLFTTILNISSTKKQKFIFTFSFSMIAIILSLFVQEPYNVFFNLLSLLILPIIIFKLHILKAIIAVIIPYIFMFIASFILQSLATFIGIDINMLMLIPIYKIVFTLCIYLILYLLYIFIKKINFKMPSVDNLKNKNKLIIILNFIIGIITISLQLYSYNLYYDKILHTYFLISTIILIFYFSISIYSLSRTTKLESTTRDLEGEKLVNKSLTILHDNIRAFKHDFNNIVQAIGGYISTNDMEGLKKYYSQLLDDCQRVNNLTTLSPQVINNPAIYSLLASKYHKADELGIKINLEIFIDLNTLNVKIYELTRIMGILLDNAIEATLECDEKIINVTMRKDDSHHRQLLIIENTYLNKDINLDKIFEKSYSTKPNNTGLGLWEVRQILKKNNNLNLFTTKDDKFFKQQLEIYI